MTDRQTLKQIERLRARIAATEKKEIKAARDLASTRELLKAHKRKEAEESPATIRLGEQIRNLGDARLDLVSERADLEGRLRDVLGELALTSPQELAGKIEGDTPIALFPVKLETRFFRVGRNHELRVRIFPDQVAISAFQEALSEAETVEGQAFWKAMAAAARTVDLDRRAAEEEAAARTLALRTEGHRTLWVALSLRPGNWPEKPDDEMPAPEKLEFPRRTGNPTNTAAAARILPDQFVVELHRGGKLIHSATTRSIRDTLLMGPDADGAVARIERDAATGTIMTTDNLRWLFDYDDAVAAGMAVTIPISGNDRGNGFDRVLALGLRFSEGGEGGAKLLSEHFRAQRFSSGLDIVPQGTPTNNTEEVQSGYDTGTPDGVDEVLRAARGDTVAISTDHRLKPDAQRLAEALGLPADAFSDWKTAGQQDISEALAMNRALWAATLGGYMRDFLSPLLGGKRTSAKDRALARAITSFATDWVAGRGILPALRVARQPYGVLVTSDLRGYNDDDRPLGLRSNPFPAEIRPVMDGFSDLFRGLAKDLRGIGRDGDPDEILINILGLHASSVMFKSRKAVSDAVSWNNMLALDFDPQVAEAFFNFIAGIRRQTLNRIGLSGAREIAELTFMRDTDDLTGPVVDGDPDLPLSETLPITAYDGSSNYIDWLLASDADTIRKQIFEDTEGNRVPRPKALLYQYLRHAYLAELAEQSAGLVVELSEQRIEKVDAHTSLVGVDSPLAEFKLPEETATVLKPEVIGIRTQAPNIGDFLVAEAGKRPDLIAGPAREFTLPLKDHRDALAMLANLPTARLERIFAEHMDTMSYRLDAWHTGLFSSRLNSMRTSRKDSKGTVIGAYGYLEDLHARPEPTALSSREIPDGILPEGVDRVVSRPDNGGFIHAPSQPHAVTAAVLRNGYLSHADRDKDSRFAINLDSSRVRKAMYLVEGLRGNQSLAALLGYKLERGLHENHPGIELDTQIYTLRARFPLTSNRLVDVPSGALAEVIEARNVVDGYDLLEQARDKSYPWGIPGLPGGLTPEAGAIRAEVDELEDMLDAYADLMMAETVHQAVGGTMERARGVLQSIAEGDIPPMPEVAETPRTGTVITQKTLIEFPAPAHLPTRSERGKANPRLNGWLVERLPAPNNVAVGFRLDGGAVQHLRLDASGLDALDTVLMAGEEQGGGATALERWLADRWRATRSVPDDAVLHHRDGPAPGGTALVLQMDTGAAPSNAHSLDDVLPLLLALQRIVTKSRPTHGLDYRLPQESADALPDNPRGLRISGGEPAARAPVFAAYTSFAANLASLKSLTEDPTLAAAHAALVSDATTFEPTDWTTAVADMRDAMRALWLFGHSQAAPRHATGLDATRARHLFEQATGLVQALEPNRAGAEAALVPIPDGTMEPAAALARRVKALDQAAAALFTGNFQIAHEFLLEAEQRAEIQPALDTPIETDPLRIETWLQGLVRVRPPLAQFAGVQDWGEWTGAGSATLTPVQLPREPGDPWVALPWPDTWTPSERMSLVIAGGDGRANGPKAGLFLDSFTETVPNKSEITGLAFHYDRPSSEPPQSILLCVPPDLVKGWSWDVLRGCVFDTFDRARLRAVEPDHLLGTDYFHVLPANLVPFSRGFFLSTFLASNTAIAAIDQG